MATDDYLDDVAAAMSQEDFRIYLGLRDQLRSLHTEIDQRETELAAIAKKYGIPGLDGHKARSTLEISASLGAYGLNINNWWAKTAPEWECPCCRRSKRDCARLDSSGRLHGKLTAHHDHIREYLDNALGDCAREDGAETFTLTEASSRVLRRFSEGLSRFDDVVICEDCNNADASAKKLVAAPEHLTFTPAEISSFILPAAHRVHKLNEQAVRTAYIAALAMYEARVEATRRLARLVLANKHWYEHQGFETRADAIERRAASAKSMFGFRHSDRSDAEFLLLEPSPKKSVFDTWRKKRREPAAPPTSNEVAFTASNNPAWSSVAEDWCCPCCSRNKLEIIRPSNQFKWIFVLQEMYFLDADQPYGRRKIVVCDACNQASRDFGMEVRSHPNVQSDGPLLFLEELQSILLPQSHGLHNIDDSSATALLVRVAERFEKE